ncbi:hypothetical protein [Arsukibacterium sp.]|uniref:hypothetical protein n=1 Tax=Arsukibacterium sp. TaxID=1977258 RepID=UPI00299EB2DA|nr:hypothetical protein [Arsukibacterium sp.]MDX1677593.1 hypothetical protein [Arsukibacterium sp.]
MANQKGQSGRPAMDEEKRQGGSKEQREQYKPDKQKSGYNPDKDQIPGRQTGRNQ